METADGATPLSTGAAVENAIRLAQEAVQADESGRLDEAIALYTQSVDLIKVGLRVQRGHEVDTTVLHKYSTLYNERITELKQSVAATAGGDAAAADGSGGPSAFSFDDSDLKDATPPVPAPTGPDEWRRPFWLMRILCASMKRGAYLTPDGRVFVPRRLWLQKNARFAALAAKIECAQCFTAELGRAKAVDHTDTSALLKEAEKLGDTCDALQNSLHRLLPFVPEPRISEAQNSNAMAKLTERFKGLAKTLDKTAARLGAGANKVTDPADYIDALVHLFDAAEVVETWIGHHVGRGGGSSDGSSGGSTSGPLLEKLHRVGTFFYEVLCAFVIQDLDGLMQRHMRKGAQQILKPE